MLRYRLVILLLAVTGGGSLLLFNPKHDRSALSPASASQPAYAVFLPFVTNVSSTAIWRPAPGASWQIQLSGLLDFSFDVPIYDLDLFDTGADTIRQIHDQGRRVICYFSAGSWEDWRPDAGQFPQKVLGKDLEGWPGEKWLDIRQLQVLAPILSARLDKALQKGCDGVDPDNMDGYQNDTGFPLTAQQQLSFNRWVAAEAHARGLSVGLKNDLDQVEDLLPDFDWALNEQCFQYNECDLLLPFIQAGKPVFEIEYQLELAEFCPAANAKNFDALKKNLELDAWREACQ